MGPQRELGDSGEHQTPDPLAPGCCFSTECGGSLCWVVYICLGWCHFWIKVGIDIERTLSSSIQKWMRWGGKNFGWKRCESDQLNLMAIGWPRQVRSVLANWFPLGSRCKSRQRDELTIRWDVKTPINNIAGWFQRSARPLATKIASAWETLLLGDCWGLGPCLIPWAALLSVFWTGASARFGGRANGCVLSIVIRLPVGMPMFCPARLPGQLTSNEPATVQNCDCRAAIKKRPPRWQHDRPI
ncbi:hypothetical protein B0T25DRAFT_226820 [Lasiosphaeria hispida]|uniref:Uncharacterized protein n=1 Tax=Lasiosphaeria hispida TaxID=260671 RepID=A0AAJ0HD72_9PEZI|nr:hypothetical protein B0T25DRAFT_226820 [Lasiosphaeria hispida]